MSDLTFSSRARRDLLTRVASVWTIKWASFLVREIKRHFKSDSAASALVRRKLHGGISFLCARTNTFLAGPLDCRCLNIAESQARRSIPPPPSLPRLIRKACGVVGRTRPRSNLFGNSENLGPLDLPPQLRLALHGPPEVQ